MTAIQGDKKLSLQDDQWALPANLVKNLLDYWKINIVRLQTLHDDYYVTHQKVYLANVYSAQVALFVRTRRHVCIMPINMYMIFKSEIEKHELGQIMETLKSEILNNKAIDFGFITFSLTVSEKVVFTISVNLNGTLKCWGIGPTKSLDPQTSGHRYMYELRCNDVRRMASQCKKSFSPSERNLEIIWRYALERHETREEIRQTEPRRETTYYSNDVFIQNPRNQNFSVLGTEQVIKTLLRRIRRKRNRIKQMTKNSIKIIMHERVFKEESSRPEISFPLGKASYDALKF
uniref:Uncharacterized protein n=1 Tax=Romanomermis culicivorax TaxID=13658 RepID=A0A915JIK8_ROMCU